MERKKVGRIMITESEKRLREYIENDIAYQEYKTNDKKHLKDYERLCFSISRDIENVLNENQQLKAVIEEVRDKILTMKASIMIDVIDGIDVDSAFITDIHKIVNFMDEKMNKEVQFR